MSKIRLLSYILISAVSFLRIESAQAVSTSVQSLEPLKLQLFAHTSEKGLIQGALDIKLEDGWHTYWKVPGDAGLPPRFDWEHSKNIESIDVHYPAPTAFNEQGFTTWGYKHHVMLPFEGHRKDSDQPSVLDLKLSIMVCKDICIPLVTTLSLDVPLKSEHSDTVKQAFDVLPLPENQDDLQIRNVVISERAVVIGGYAEKGLENTGIFAVTADGIALTNRPQLGVDKENPRQGLIVIDKPDDIDNLNDYVAGQSLEVILTDGEKAVSQIIKVPAK